MPLQFSTPINQTTFNTTEDQYNYELNNIVLNNPSIYITRIIERMFAGATSTDWVSTGLDVTFDPLTINTNSLSFSITPGLGMFDTDLIRIGSTDVIVSDIPIPFPAVGSYTVCIFANHTFSIGGPTNLTYSSYVCTQVLPITPIAPAVFAGTEKVLLAIFDVVSDGTVWTSAIRQNARLKREVEPFVPASDAPLENTVTLGGTTFLVRGNANKLASQFTFTFANQNDGVFILDSFLYKPKVPFLFYEVTGMFSQGAF